MELITPLIQLRLHTRGMSIQLGGHVMNTWPRVPALKLMAYAIYHSYNYMNYYIASLSAGYDCTKKTQRFIACYIIWFILHDIE